MREEQRQYLQKELELSLPGIKSLLEEEFPQDLCIDDLKKIYSSVILMPSTNLKESGISTEMYVASRLGKDFQIVESEYGSVCRILTYEYYGDLPGGISRWHHIPNKHLVDVVINARDHLEHYLQIAKDYFDEDRKGRKPKSPDFYRSVVDFIAPRVLLAILLYEKYFFLGNGCPDITLPDGEFVEAKGPGDRIRLEQIYFAKFCRIFPWLKAHICFVRKNPKRVDTTRVLKIVSPSDIMMHAHEHCQELARVFKKDIF